MKRPVSLIFLFSSLCVGLLTPLDQTFAKDMRIEAEGEIVSVDPIYSSVRISHSTLRGLSASGQTDFTVSSKDLIQNLSSGDLVKFEIHSQKSGMIVDKIEKIGHKDPAPSLTAGQYVHEALKGTANVAKGVTALVPPANEWVSGVVDGGTEATGSALENVGPETKSNF